MDTAPDPRPDLTAAQRIAIALGTAADPRQEMPTDPADPRPDALVDTEQHRPGTPA